VERAKGEEGLATTIAERTKNQERIIRLQIARSRVLEKERVETTLDLCFRHFKQKQNFDSESVLKPPFFRKVMLMIKPKPKTRC
jgi:hypothetical protein